MFKKIVIALSILSTLGYASEAQAANKIMVNSQTSQVTLIRTGLPNISRWVTMSQACFAHTNTAYRPLTYVDAGQSTGNMPKFLITNSGSLASSIDPTDPICRVLIPDNADYTLYTANTNKYKFFRPTPPVPPVGLPGVSSLKITDQVLEILTDTKQYFKYSKLKNTNNFQETLGEDGFKYFSAPTNIKISNDVPRFSAKEFTEAENPHLLDNTVLEINKNNNNLE